MERFEIVYTRSNKCVLDVGLNLGGGNSTTYIMSRATTLRKGQRTLYGNSAKSFWYRTGVYVSEEEWNVVTMDRSAESICNYYRIKYWFNETEEQFKKERERLQKEKERSEFKMASTKIEYLEFSCDVCGKIVRTPVYEKAPDKWERVKIGFDVSYDMCEECVNKVVDFIRNLRHGV